MGFFDAIGAVLQSDMGHDAFNKIFKSSSDSKLIEWWDNRENCSNIDLEIINLAEKEMNRRGLTCYTGYISEECLEKYKSIFRQADNNILRDWYFNHFNVPEQLREAAKEELQNRDY